MTFICSHEVKVNYEVIVVEVEVPSVKNAEVVFLAMEEVLAFCT
jgi:hypothetical protein